MNDWLVSIVVGICLTPFAVIAMISLWQNSKDK